ncbi:MAG: cell division protein FtsH [Candidatus Buchananbacteria bacterium RBG_13_36_9]|uniref:ATP-dependent zinc metalloprotease FtsH n=1 Tax=Candidatus Buchananbacteria bacterium RBG_13_36_9 TaxID=1797530 RepID=A0A1G1XLH7_9BACT|nr:MAG: cell division protein FtsH [Candidatus Buchananbacteria bacterium RBG_13_36_9]
MAKIILKNFLIFLIIFLVIAALFNTYTATLEKTEEIGIEKLLAQIENEEIKQIVVKNSKLEIVLNNGQKEITKKEANESLSELLRNYNVNPEKTKKIQIAIKENEGFGFWAATILPFLIPFLLIAVFIYIMMRQVQGANTKALSFGQSQARELKQKGKEKTTFKDVAGCKEAKEELTEVVEFLKNPHKFTQLGAKIPKGVLLMGAPGTGKTLLAKAVAGEANVPFFSISGSEFVEMFVGVGASRVRDLFKRAKKSAPCIIFIDELDAVGRQRGAGLGGSHDEREQTLNQILVEMDGMETKTNIIVMAATNRPDILDPALLRPGRFDRRVILDLPDINDREAILKVHAKNKPLAKEVALRKAAERTPGFSGADLANLLNEAAILTARRNKKQIEMSEIFESVEKVLLGPERKSHILTDKEKKITAYHEAGHALVAHELPNVDPIHKVSIISRGQAAGYTLKLPEEDRHLHSKSEFIDELAVFLGGFMAEKQTFKDVTTGASNDLRQATQLAKRIITEYGMDETLGPRTFGEREELIFLGKEIHEQRDYSEKTAELIDQQISALINQAQTTALNILIKKQKSLEKIVAELLIKETLEREDFEKLLGPKKNK